MIPHRRNQTTGLSLELQFLCFREKTHLLVAANAFKLEGKEWKPLDDGKGSKVALVENNEGRFRVVAMNSSNEVPVAWFIMDDF